MSRLRVCVATGSRAEFGLLRTVMRAVRAHPALELKVAAMGSHLLAPAETWREVEREFAVDAIIPMQRTGAERGLPDRLEDAMATGRGMAALARIFAEMEPAWVVVLGDRIEAFAAASAASIGGIGVAHLHGGDRAEGVADEAMRHAITKLAHLHLAATEASAARIVRMGERPEDVRVVGSPAIDGLAGIPALTDGDYEALGAPDTLVLMHPIGRSDEQERRAVESVLRGAGGGRLLALAPNHDAGRGGVAAALAASGVRVVEHLERGLFVGLLRRVAERGGALVGNSSAGLIEAAAIRPALAVVNVGDRQAGRERAGNVIDCAEDEGGVREALARARTLRPGNLEHPYGDGRAGERAAAALAEGPAGARLRKRCAY
ncbi:MAG: UDP-N-acetylglucosamine 2-epimerase (hydrolyzing) [Phycisphaerales bacterium]|nr:UDP-N-acetylglucosamine 2-epimerase (hydrolyzing) [Phycisphaerales bacterium]